MLFAKRSMETSIAPNGLAARQFSSFLRQVRSICPVPVISTEDVFRILHYLGKTINYIFSHYRLLLIIISLLILLKNMSTRKGLVPYFFVLRFWSISVRPHVLIKFFMFQIAVASPSFPNRISQSGFLRHK